MSWIDLAEIKCKDKIKLTIKLDEVRKDVSILFLLLVFFMLL